MELFYAIEGFEYKEDQGKESIHSIFYTQELEKDHYLKVVELRYPVNSTLRDNVIIHH